MQRKHNQDIDRTWRIDLSSKKAVRVYLCIAILCLRYPSAAATACLPSATAIEATLYKEHWYVRKRLTTYTSTRIYGTHVLQSLKVCSFSLLRVHTII